MADTPYGTLTTCPQILAYVGSEPRCCQEAAEVFLTDDGDYKSVCPAGHEHRFDVRYEPNVEPL